MSASIQISAAAEARASTDASCPNGEPPSQLETLGNEKPGNTRSLASPTTPTDEETAASQPHQGLSELVLQRWNEPRVNIYRFFTTLLSFIIMGMNDGAVGALIPYIETYYNIGYTVISLLFLAPFLGYLLAALSNNFIHHHFGQLGIAVFGPLCRLIGYIPLALHPPYAALPFVMFFPGLGNGLEDSAWNAWIGNMQQANELLGFLHGAYGLGATIGPLVASAMIAQVNPPLPWYAFYYLMIGLAGAEIFFTTTAFWGASAQEHRERHKSTGGGATRKVLRMPIPWMVALFLLGYVGVEVSLGGWIVTFMLRVRNAGKFAAGLTVTFFWLGLTVGRVVLGFISGRVGEKLAITGYLLLSIALQLLYWLVPSFVASAIFVAFLGFFLGPLFPAAIVAATKLLPAEWHVSAIGFAAAFGGGGAAIFPFAVGAIAERKGVEVLQPIVLALMVFNLLTWWCLPGGFRRGGLERARESQERIGQGFCRVFGRISKRASQKAAREASE